MMYRGLAALRTDESGATIIEFAIIIPVMLMLIMGLGEFAFQAYVQSVLSGAMQFAGRNSTIQGNESDNSGKAIDQQVMKSVWSVISSATYASSRKSYAQFGTIAPEPFQDNNKNGLYDAASECFTDMNGNKKWDADPGLNGQGGAGDVVLYKIDVSYPRLFPVVGVLGMPAKAAISSTTILKNQPYKTQVAYTPTQVCPS